MYTFKVNGNSYKIKFAYRVLYKSDLIDRVLTAMTGTEDSPAESVKNMIGLTGELLLAGLQKYHKEEFGFDFEDEAEKSAKLDIVCDMIDDYEDEHTDEDGNREEDAFTLFTDLQLELEKNGFLSRLTDRAQETLAEQDATVVPMEHQRKKKKDGANK